MVMDNNRLVYDMEVGSIMSVAYAENDLYNMHLAENAFLQTRQYS